jgi:hypothetical protein
MATFDRTRHVACDTLDLIGIETPEVAPWEANCRQDPLGFPPADRVLVDAKGVSSGSYRHVLHFVAPAFPAEWAASMVDLVDFVKLRVSASPHLAAVPAPGERLDSIGYDRYCRPAMNDQLEGPMDDLELSIQRRVDANPGHRDLLEAEVRRQRLIQGLVAQRKANNLTQAAVAKAMNVGQSVVAEIESAKADVRFSTLERYAAAVTRGRSHLAVVRE